MNLLNVAGSQLSVRALRPLPSGFLALLALLPTATAPGEPRPVLRWLAQEHIRQENTALTAVDFVRAPRTADKHRGVNDAYARIQYLLPVPGGRRLAFNDIRGILYLTDMQGSPPQVYLDLNRQDVRLSTTRPHGESGFMGFAFHPDFAVPDKPGHGKFYTAHTAERGTAKADYDQGDALVDQVVREWTAKDPQANVFAGTSREVLRVGSGGVHNVGTIAFHSAANEGDEDYGLLYIGFGDGASHFYYSPRNHAQSLATPLGAIARIDPLDTADGRRYGIPASNPFVGRANAAAEIWAYGLRHPQQFSWDADGRMFIADIGQDRREEINLGIAGGNYGWPLREGTFVTREAPRYGASHHSAPPSSFTCPVAQYHFSGGPSAVGGVFVYRGIIKALRGKYVFTDIVRGRLLAIDAQRLDPKAPNPIVELRLAVNEAQISLADVSGFCHRRERRRFRRVFGGLQHEFVSCHPMPRVDARLGIDHDGELYVLTKGDGWIRKLVDRQNHPLGAPAPPARPSPTAASDAKALWRSDFNGYARRLPTGSVEGIVLARERCGRYDRTIRAAFVPVNTDSNAATMHTLPLHSCGGCGVLLPFAGVAAETLSSVRVGQTAEDGGDWAMEVLLDAGEVAGVLRAPRCWTQPTCPTNPNIARLRDVRQRARTAAPAARAAFDVYLGGDSIDYVRAPCDLDDVANRFFLHAVPREVRDLPPARRPQGFENLDFGFWEHGGVLGDACVATVRLPPWPVRELRTGQVGANRSGWHVGLDSESPADQRGTHR